MTKIDEMLQQIEGMKVEAKALVEAKDVEGAKAKMKEIEDVKALLEVEQALADDEEKQVTNKIKTVKDDEKMEKVNKMVVFNKLVAGMKLTEAENTLATTGQIEKSGEQGGYLVPAEQFTKIKELRRAYVELKQLCNVMPVVSDHGSMPVGKDATGELIAFDELADISQADVRFDKVEFNTADYGVIVPVSNSLITDEKVGILPIISKDFVKRSVKTENKKIIEILKTATKSTGTDYKAIVKCLNKELDPAISANAVILTNQTGFDYLDNLEDKNGRPMLTTSLADETQKMFKGRKVVVMADADLAFGSGKTGFYVGDVAEMVTFFDKEGMEVAKSTEAGFVKNATLVRAIERFDVKGVDKAAVRYVELTIA